VLSLGFAAAAAGPDAVVFPAGTAVPIRFLETLTSGRDSIGTRLRVQTMGALANGRCEIVPPFTLAAGVVTLSRSGRLFGGRGAISARFDSLEIAPGRWIAISAVLDTLEYTSSDNLSDSGVAYGRHASLAGRAVPVGIAGAASVAAPPAALFGGYWLARRGPPAKIVSGEVGGLRLTEPVALTAPAQCRPAAASRALGRLPRLPAFQARTETKHGDLRGDPVNLVVLGSPHDLASAFERAGWLSPVRGTVRTVTSEIFDGLSNRQATAAPLSSQYLGGRRQDVAYELAGPNARYRHHARFWLLDSTTDVWIGAATNDVGVKVNPLKGRFTHRIDPAVDDERDRIVQELEATDCADLIDYTPVPGSTAHGRNASGQAFVTDGRAAVIRVRACEPR
jgi:hypothetical protein